MFPEVVTASYKEGECSVLVCLHSLAIQYRVDVALITERGFSGEEVALGRPKIIRNIFL